MIQRIIVLFAGVTVGWATTTPQLPHDSKVLEHLQVKELRVANGQLLLGMGTENGPGLWIKNSRGGSLQAAVHAGGLPMLLVGDGAIRNFGLGRADGANQSPLLIFRSNDEVRLLLGLDMSGSAKDPFLVRYAADGKKNLQFGKYCDTPSRVCP